MILVTAANGNQGRALIPRLLATGANVRACVRTKASAERLREAGVTDIILADLSDPNEMARAMDGVTQVYHVGPTMLPSERKMGLAAVDAARASGVKHFVFSSVLHAITTDLVQHELKRDIEEHLLSSGLEFTILQPANYMLPHRLRAVFERGVFELAWSLDRRQSLVDIHDVAEVAAAVLLDRQHHIGATYELVSSGQYTAHDLGRIMSGIVGRKVAVEEISPDTFFRSRIGEPSEFPYQARVMRAISARYSSHDFTGNPNVLTWLLGRSPTPFAEFVQREFEAYKEVKLASREVGG